MARESVPTYLTLQQAAEITHQSIRTIRRRVSQGSLPAYRFGPRQIRIKLDDLQSLGRRIPAAHSSD
jgi:excisionase family DNA binding protein